MRMVLSLFFSCYRYQCSRYCVNYTFDEGRSVFILFGFEFGLLVIDIFNLMFRYIINCTDTYLENGLHNKGIAFDVN